MIPKPQTLVWVHFELVVAGPVVVTSDSGLETFPGGMTRGGIEIPTAILSNVCVTIKTEAGATTDDSNEDAECW